MLSGGVKMLKKKLGLEAIERDWSLIKRTSIETYFKIPSSLIIPDGCMKIGDRAFCDCKELSKIEIPKSVEVIGISAFDWCDNAVVILEKPKSEFKYIGPYAFWECKNVKEEVGN